MERAQIRDNALNASFDLAQSLLCIGVRRGLLARKPTSTSNSPSYTELRLESAEFAEFQLRICAQAEGKTETLRDVLTEPRFRAGARLAWGWPICGVIVATSRAARAVA